MIYTTACTAVCTCVAHLLPLTQPIMFRLASVLKLDNGPLLLLLLLLLLYAVLVSTYCRTTFICMIRLER